MATTTMSETKAPDALVQWEEPRGTRDVVGARTRRQIGMRPA
jgi:hypothetical protein